MQHQSAISNVGSKGMVCSLVIRIAALLEAGRG